MFRTLILKGVKVLTKIIKYILIQARYILVASLYLAALLFDVNYNFLKRRFLARSECMQEFIIYIMLALSIYAINDLLPKKEISNLSTKLETKEVVIEASVLSDNANDIEIEEASAEEKNICELDEISCKIKNTAMLYGIDYKMAIAIAKHETGNYTSNAYANKNNVGGMMYWDAKTKSSRLITYTSIDEGIEAFISNLKRNYYDLGLDTIEEIQKKYAPVGVANDPNNLNSNWVMGVSMYYSQLD